MKDTVIPIDDGNCNPPMGITPSPSTASSPTGPPEYDPIVKEGFCVAVDMLSHFDSSTLIFGAHVQGAVLCDQFASCATPGHMLLFLGRPMSMKEYCALPDVTCVKRVKLVNSPKMKIGLRISSRSPHMQFTAFAARKETWLETATLKLLLKMGV